MNRYTPRNSVEFEARQQCFDFGMACRFVADLTASVKNSLTKFVRKFFAKPDNRDFPPEQLFLDLSLSNSPLFLLQLDPLF